MKPLDDLWMFFRRAMLHPNADRDQVECCHAAFLAGAHSALAIIDTLSELTQEQAADGVEKLRREIRSGADRHKVPEAEALAQRAILQ